MRKIMTVGRLTWVPGDDKADWGPIPEEYIDINMMHNIIIAVNLRSSDKDNYHSINACFEYLVNTVVAEKKSIPWLLMPGSLCCQDINKHGADYTGILALHEEIFQLSMPSEHTEIIKKNANVFFVSWNKFSTTRFENLSYPNAHFCCWDCPIQYGPGVQGVDPSTNPLKMATQNETCK